ncbi:methionine ABC transporter ATP-binding protein [Ligilactobacillus acidipiscis]|uniref:methionine ABC transporter ATP-binding protein n=2 Tax=Ligilactobacillus acidipiscis TaxID=89059 RepID=UPI000A23F8EF|nr:methionine ABC transporter ATP-binding protein [Ligilactobacillus acidipiscis]GEN20884.1 methionine import ATP-binding protein MetN 1 [Ligilactobacillus acidipiscis]
MSKAEVAIDLQDINVSFDKKGETFTAVDDVSLQVRQGSVYGIVGYSGAGKSTLVRVINLLQRPTSGTVTVSGQNLQELNDKKLRKVRKKIGMIFQQFNLLQSRTVLNNVEYPLLSEKTPHAKRKAKAQRLLELVGLADYAASYPEDLSGGQKQRVAIARALANDPDILISDEATSALDPQTTDSILQLLQKLNEKFGLTVVLITHEMEVIKSICQEMAVMEDGRIIERGPVGQVFAQPKQSLTQTFIESAANVTQMRQQVVDDDLLANLTAGERLLYLQFSSQVTDESVISELTAKFGIKANILFANVQKVAQLSLGYMLVILSEKDGKVEPGITYLKNVGVTVTDLAVQERSPENAS